MSKAAISPLPKNLIDNNPDPVREYRHIESV